MEVINKMHDKAIERKMLVKKKVKELLNEAEKYTSLGFFNKAIEVTEEIKDILEEDGDKSYELIVSYKLLSFYYALEREAEKAFDYLEKMRNHKDYEKVAIEHNELGLNYDKYKKIIEDCFK